MLSLSIRRPDWQRQIEALAADAATKSKLVLETVGIEVTDYLKSLTPNLRPPVRKSEGWRQAHPGGWADVTGVLAASYSWEVVPVDGGWRLVLKNTADYAIYLEQRDGFFVLGGVADPGGIVEQALLEIAPRIAPGMRVVIDGPTRALGVGE